MHARMRSGEWGPIARERKERCAAPPPPRSAVSPVGPKSAEGSLFSNRKSLRAATASTASNAHQTCPRPLPAPASHQHPRA
eukprot:1021724-Prorocentrum_minimum.AAC.1